jgi:hypothetical protein
MNTHQNVLEERLSSLENKLVVLQETLAALPEEISRHLTMTQLNNSSRNLGPYFHNNQNRGDLF